MWTKLDDHFLRNRKLRAAGRDATMLYLAGLLHCSENLTDGVILDSELSLLAPVAWVDSRQLASLIARLERPLPAQPDLALWERIEGGYRVHDFLDYNPSAEGVKEERRRNAERQARMKRRRRSATAPAENTVPIDGNNAVTHATANSANHDSPSRPVPVSVSVSDLEPDLDPDPSITADETDEVAQIFVTLGVVPSPIARAAVVKAIDDHPATDPLSVALEYARWQECETFDRDAGNRDARVHRDRLKGWSNALHRAAGKGFYARLSVCAESREIIEMGSEPTGVAIWDEALRELAATMGEDNARQWFAPLRPLSHADNVLTLGVPDAAHLDWLEQRLHARLQYALDMGGHPDTVVRYVLAASDGESEA